MQNINSTRDTCPGKVYHCSVRSAPHGTRKCQSFACCPRHTSREDRLLGIVEGVNIRATYPSHCAQNPRNATPDELRENASWYDSKLCSKHLQTNPIRIVRASVAEAVDGVGNGVANTASGISTGSVVLIVLGILGLASGITYLIYYAMTKSREREDKNSRHPGIREIDVRKLENQLGIKIDRRLTGGAELR